MNRHRATALAALAVLVPVANASARVLRVGTYKGIRGQYTKIQAAVDAARPGDWILVAPGDYKTISSSEPAGRKNTPAGILITKPRIYVRGMSRNKGSSTGPSPAPLAAGRSATKTSVRADRADVSDSTA